MDLYISHDKSKRLNIYLFGLFFYTSIRIKERVVNLMIKFGKGVVKHRVLILIVAFALLIPSGISFINTRINFDILSYLPSQIETMKGQDIMVDEFGTGALSFVILEDMKDQDIETLADDIEDLKGVNDVITMNIKIYDDNMNLLDSKAIKFINDKLAKPCEKKLVNIDVNELNVLFTKALDDIKNEIAKEYNAKINEFKAKLECLCLKNVRNEVPRTTDKNKVKFDM